jgi:hypothetical protein
MDLVLNGTLGSWRFPLEEEKENGRGKKTALHGSFLFEGFFRFSFLSRRENGALASSSDGRRVFMYGGGFGTILFSNMKEYSLDDIGPITEKDTHLNIFDTKSKEWTRVKPNGETPSVRVAPGKFFSVLSLSFFCLFSHIRTAFNQAHQRIQS